MRVKIINIFEDIINRTVNVPEYITPTFVGLFEGKHHTVTSEFEMEDPCSQQHIMYLITRYIIP